MSAHAEQAAQVERVSSRIAAALVAFWAWRLRDQPEFLAGDVLAYVRERVGEVAPDSPGRILRDLRGKGAIAYEVVSRAESRYRATPLALPSPVPEPPKPWRPEGLPVPKKPQLDLFGGGKR